MTEAEKECAAGEVINETEIVFAIPLGECRYEIDGSNALFLASRAPEIENGYATVTVLPALWAGSTVTSIGGDDGCEIDTTRATVLGESSREIERRSAAAFNLMAMP